MRKNLTIFILFIIFFNSSPSFSSYEEQEREDLEDKQVDHFTHSNTYSLGEQGNTVLFVNNLDQYIVDSLCQKELAIPSSIHEKMAILGHSINFFREEYPEPNYKPRNILIPHISFLVRKNDKFLNFIEGSYLNFGEFEKQENEKVTVFLSGSTNLTKKAKKAIDEKRKEGNFPQIDYINAQEIPFELPCTRHTEPLFWKTLLRKPESILHVAHRVLNPREDKIEHIFFDFYSFFDVCKNCQDIFKEERFKNDVLINVKKTLREHFRINDCLIYSFRVNSYVEYNFGYDSSGKQFKYGIPRDLTNAYGGSDPKRKGINAKLSAQHHILLDKRTITGSHSYDYFKQNLKKKRFRNAEES